MKENNKTKINWPYSTAYVPPFIENKENVLTETQKNVKLDTGISLIGSDFDIDSEQLDVIDEVKILTKSNMKRCNFKIESMRILITYEGVKLNKINLLDHINNIMKCKTIDDYIIVHERCESTDEYHTHMYIKFNDIFQTVNRKVFNFLKVQPNIDKILHCDTNIYLVHQYLFQRDINPHTNLSAERIQRIKYNILKQLNVQSDLFNISNKAKEEITISDDISKLILSYFPNTGNNFDHISANVKSEPIKLINNILIKDLSEEKCTDFDSNINSKYSKCENIIDIVKILTKTNSKLTDFKINSMRILLTYQGVKLNKIDLFNYIDDIVDNKNRKIDEYIIAHEFCNIEHIHHTHMYIKFTKGFLSYNRELFDYNNKHPNVERVLHHVFDIKPVMIYLFQKDSEAYNNLDVEKIQDITRVVTRMTHNFNQSLNKINDAQTFKKCDKSSGTPVTSSYSRLEDNVHMIERWNFKPWKEFLLNIIEGKVDKREFYWCLEPSGFTEKAELAQYILSNYKNVLLIETIDNVKSLYLEAIKKRSVQIVIFDLPRKITNCLDNFENSDIFDFIETLKIGLIVGVVGIGSQNGCLILNPCHVIVFSTCITGIKEIDYFRWKIIKILKDGEAHLGHVNEENEIEYNENFITIQ